MRPSQVLLPGASALTPYEQGHVSSLCGLYSLLNAIQLVLWPQKLTRKQTRDLFTRGIAHLDAMGVLPEILYDGMAEDIWLGLGRVLIDHASKLSGTRIRRQFIVSRREPLTRRSAISMMKQQLRFGRPVLLILWGAYDHVTVVAGYRSGRLILFDSAGFKWINEVSLGLQHPSSSKCHQLTRTSVITLSVKRRHSGTLDW